VSKQAGQQPVGDGAFRSGPPREHSPLRDNLESIALAILLVLCVRQMVVEAFRIRHGSMAPTLVGDHREIRCPNCGWTFNSGRDNLNHEGEVECPNCHWHWAGAARVDEGGLPMHFRRPEWLWNQAKTADGKVLTGSEAANRVYRGAARIFVNKFIYRLRKPRRWEVAVFVFPLYNAHCKVCDWTGRVASLDDVCPDCGSRELELQARNFIKRIVGLPGERVQLRDGDVYVNGSLARKPPRVQSQLWFHVFDSRFWPEQEVRRIWDLSPHLGRWEFVDGGARLVLDAMGTGGHVLGAFAPAIVDYYAYDGLSYQLAGDGLHTAGQNPVGDCRIRALVRVPERGESAGVALAIEDAGHEFLCSFSADGSGVELRDGGIVTADAQAPSLPCDEPVWIALENYDDRVVARVDGEAVLSYDYEGEPALRHGVRFGAHNALVEWDRIVIDRDIYYANVPRDGAARPQHELGDDEYFVLGDNSPASSDSRRWRDPGIPEENLIGRAFFVFWPVHQMKWLTANGSTD